MIGLLLITPMYGCVKHLDPAEFDSDISIVYHNILQVNEILNNEKQKIEYKELTKEAEKFIMTFTMDGVDVITAKFGKDEVLNELMLGNLSSVEKFDKDLFWPVSGMLSNLIFANNIEEDTQLMMLKVMSFYVEEEEYTVNDNELGDLKISKYDKKQILKIQIEKNR